jgi:integrase
MTLTDLIAEYSQQQEFSKTSVSRLRYWKQELGDRRLIDITQDVVRASLKSLGEGKAHRGNGKRKGIAATTRQRAPATVNRMKSALSAVFEYGREHCGLTVNPCRGIRRRPENSARVRFLTDAERKALLNASKDSTWGSLHLLTLMAITTGARQGELLRLRWRDLRLPDRRANVEQTKNGEPRVLPLTGGGVELLKALPRPLDGETLLFRSFSDPHKPYEFRPHWDTAVKSAGLTNFRFHDLRHTCASYLAQSGVTFLEIADVLGHKQLGVAKRYSQLCVDHKQDLVDRVLGDMR